MKSRTILTLILSLLITASLLFTGCGNTPEQPTMAEHTLAPDATPTATTEIFQATHTPDPVDFLGDWTTEIDKDIINILLIGNDSDSPDGDGNGRNDTTMVLQINRVDKTMKLISFMRDMVFNVPGVGETSLNNAFYHGGARTVSKLMKNEFDITIHYYASVSFNSFHAVMDTIGRVSIDPSQNIIPDISQAAVDVSKNPTNMTPQTSLNYVRDRKTPIIEPDTGYKLQSDEARNYRQRVFISSVWGTVKTFPTMSVPIGVFAAVTYVDTDMDEATMITLITEMMDANATIETLGLPARRSGEKPYYSLYEDLRTEEIVTKSEIETMYNSASDKGDMTFEEWKDTNYKESHIIGWNVGRTTEAIKNFLVTD